MTPTFESLVIFIALHILFARTSFLCLQYLAFSIGQNVMITELML